MIIILPFSVFLPSALNRLKNIFYVSLNKKISFSVILGNGISCIAVYRIDISWRQRID